MYSSVTPHQIFTKQNSVDLKMLAEYRGNAVTISREAITKNLTLISLSLLLIINMVIMIMS